jgi:hypothetical protein
MRTALIFFLLALPTWAQEKATTAATGPACGPNNIKFDVTLDKSQHAVAQPEPGKALIYFIQDIGEQHFGVTALTWIALDGAWVGANKNNSYFSVSLQPGEHHMCSILRSEWLGHPVEFAHFTAEAGKVYYFRARYTAGFLFIDAVDNDEARYLIDTYPQSVSQPKK